MFNGQEFETLDPKELLLHVIKCTQTPKEWDMKPIVLVGMQGSGKTVFIRYFVHLLRQNPDYKRLGVVATNDPRIIKDPRYADLFRDKDVLCIIVDDAIGEGMDSRRSMSGDNVNLTQEFCVTRHTLEELYENRGIVFMIFAVQVYSRLDATIRETAVLKIFESYYDQKWFHQIFNPEEAELLRLATFEGMVGYNFDARRFALAKLITGETATLEIPYSSKSQVRYPVIDRSLPRSRIKQMLKDALRLELESLNAVVSDFTRGQLKGFLKETALQIQKDYTARVTKQDVLDAIESLDYEYAKKELIITQNLTDITIRPNQKLKQYEKIAIALKQDGLASIDRLCEITGLDADTVRANLSTKKNEMFENVEKGVWCLLDYEYSEKEIEKYKTKPKPPPKKLKL